jgi:hypothetical protein
MSNFISNLASYFVINWINYFVKLFTIDYLNLFFIFKSHFVKNFIS